MMNTTILRNADSEQPAATLNRARPNAAVPATDPRRWLALLAKVLLPGGLFAISLFGALANPAQAQTANPESKIAADLQEAVAAPVTPKLNWAKDVNGIRYVKALLIGNDSDPELTALRAAVVANGGSVYMRYVSVARFR